MVNHAPDHTIRSEKRPRHIRSPMKHEALMCGATSAIEQLNGWDIEVIYCSILTGDIGELPCLECVRQFAFTLSGGKVS